MTNPMRRLFDEDELGEICLNDLRNGIAVDVVVPTHVGHFVGKLLLTGIENGEFEPLNGDLERICEVADRMSALQTQTTLKVDIWDLEAICKGCVDVLSACPDAEIDSPELRHQMKLLEEALLERASEEGDIPEDRLAESIEVARRHAALLWRVIEFTGRRVPLAREIVGWINRGMGTTERARLGLASPRHALRFYETVTGPFRRSVKKERRIGRNEPCPCGSGRKYKKCCLLRR